MVGVGAASEVLSRPEEKEASNPGQIADCALAFFLYLTGDVECLDCDEDWADLGRWRLLLCVRREFSTQAKVKIS